jgi:uncharacterized membrane protein
LRFSTMLMVCLLILFLVFPMIRTEGRWRTDLRIHILLFS